MRLLFVVLMATLPLHQAAAQKAPETAKAPTFEQPDELVLSTLDGKEVKFSKYRSKVTVISIWATWCAPCIEELPLVDELYRTYKDDKEVSVLSVNVDFAMSMGKIPSEIGDTIKEKKIEMPVLVDRERLFQEWLSTGKVKKKEPPNKGKPPFFKTSSSLRLPQIVIIDSKARIYRRYGYSPTRTKEDYLAEKKEIIEQARRGKLPKYEPPMGQDIAMKVARLVFMKKHDEAEKILLDALEKDKKNTVLLYQLGRFYYDLESFDEYSKVMRRIIEIDPKHDSALNHLGYYLADHDKDLDEAGILVGKALDLRPGNGHYLDSMGWVFFKKGDFKKAKEYLEKAVETYREALKKSIERRSYRSIFKR
jgi:tetratricopeptide (TPR) repeat protein